MNIRNAILAESEHLPTLDACYQYVVARDGLFIRAADDRMSACVPIGDALALHGLAEVEPTVWLRLPHVPERFLRSILASARSHMPREAMYQLYFDLAQGGWRCVMPPQAGSPAAVQFTDRPDAVIDLHSHNTMAAFFSSTDDADEQGFRFYCVIGRLDRDWPDILCRVGVYGHTLDVPAETIFEGLGPFIDLYGVPDAEEESDAQVAELIA